MVFHGKAVAWEGARRRVKGINGTEGMEQGAMERKFLLNAEMGDDVFGVT